MSSRTAEVGLAPKPARRFGVIATDPLRVAGLESIFADWKNADLGEVVVVPLTGENPGGASNLSLLLIDASCTDHLFELLATLARAHPRLRTIVIGLAEDFDYIGRVIGAGARGYLTHSATPNEIRMSVEIVLDGSVWAPRKVLARLLDSNQRATAATNAEIAARFTPREIEVLRLLVAGQPNREIGAALGIDEGTVKAHVGRLMRKVGVDNRTALSVLTLEQRLLPSAESES